MTQPLVSVIITCFNQAPYLMQAVDSVLTQNYDNLEIILIDDASSDASVATIKKITQTYPFIKAIFNQRNRGVCTSFNKALSISNGAYIVDLAADDFLLPNKIALQLDKFKCLPNDYGVVYSDLSFVDDKGNELMMHNKNKVFPEGDIFSKVVATHCVYACTMLVKREVYDDLKGYDESLEYEDFDFFVRAARNWKFACVKKILMSKRELENSLGKQFFRGKNGMGQSTLKVCYKAKKMIRNKDEKKALKQRLYYEAYDAFRHGYCKLAAQFLLV